MACETMETNRTEVDTERRHGRDVRVAYSHSLLRHVRQRKSKIQEKYTA